MDETGLYVPDGPGDYERGRTDGKDDACTEWLPAGPLDYTESQEYWRGYADGYKEEIE